MSDQSSDTPVVPDVSAHPPVEPATPPLADAAVPDSSPVAPDAAAPDGKPRKLSLRAAQELALQNLAAGRSISDAARTVGVDRRTLYRWIHDDARFAAAYNAWRREVVDSGRARILAMSNRALDAVQTAIENGDARIALQVAKASGALDAPQPGLTDADTLGRKRKLRDGQRAMKLEAAEDQFRRDLGENPRQILKRLELLEPHIDLLLKLRRVLIGDEKPEDRAKRLAQAGAVRFEFEATQEIFALADARCPPERRNWWPSDDPAPAAPPAPGDTGAQSTAPAALDAPATSDPAPIITPPAEPAAFKLAPLAAPAPPALAPAPAPRLTKALVTRARPRPYDPDAPDPLDEFFEM